MPYCLPHTLKIFQLWGILYDRDQTARALNSDGASRCTIFDAILTFWGVSLPSLPHLM
ncbi:hypothetical protein KP509_22G010100 [Ceratopteris richardii]|uniref:Uncharacterized protein n=1 Tax=Ceratopteris richardii TaxID=49495 RepID=A0A8T2S4R3_CERRI|nr:hypothetical protein KP509_22G010100 [Ceratopteris richardii]